MMELFLSPKFTLGCRPSKETLDAVVLIYTPDSGYEFEWHVMSYDNGSWWFPGESPHLTIEEQAVKGHNKWRGVTILSKGGEPLPAYIIGWYELPNVMS